MALPTTTRNPYIIEPRRTFQELRELNVREIPPQITFTICKETVGDGYCFGWYWDKDSVSVDDNYSVLAPVDRAVGRWHAMGTASGGGGGGNLPAPTSMGQVLYSLDGINYSWEQPVTSDDGWLVNVDGILIVI